MTPDNYITLALFALGVLLGAYGFVYRLDKRVSAIESRCTTHQPVIDSIALLNSRLDRVEAHDETFWRILGPPIAGIIHSPTAHDRDALIDRLTLHPGAMTCPDLDTTIALLKTAIQNPAWTAEKRLAGAMLLARATQLLMARTRECS